MQTDCKRIALVVASLVLASGLIARADDEAKLAKAPTAVQATVKKAMGEKGKLEGCDTVQSDGKAAYDIDIKLHHAEYGMLVSETGEVLEREVAVNTAIVPQAVLDAASKAHPDGKGSEVSIITHGDQMYYEVELKVGDTEHDINISAGGNVLADTVAKPEADEADEAHGHKDAKGGKEDKEDKGDKD